MNHEGASDFEMKKLSWTIADAVFSSGTTRVELPYHYSNNRLFLSREVFSESIHKGKAKFDVTLQKTPK